jgi:hypothetical protein
MLIDRLGEPIDVDNAMAFIAKAAQLAGHFPDTKTMDRALRVLTGELTEDEATKEIFTGYRQQ